jgi:hypothetical protein
MRVKKDVVSGGLVIAWHCSDFTSARKICTTMSSSLNISQKQGCHYTLFLRVNVTCAKNVK